MQGNEDEELLSRQDAKTGNGDLSKQSGFLVLVGAGENEISPGKLCPPKSSPSLLAKKYPSPSLLAKKYRTILACKTPNQQPRSNTRATSHLIISRGESCIDLFIKKRATSQHLIIITIEGWYLAEVEVERRDRGVIIFCIEQQQHNSRPKQTYKQPP